ncbi:class I SAM-dependent methyltransferase [Clostridium sp. D2Q-11]|uniref:Class I SAM-dependent methyltransferase n=1 Tax=Anaeromonas frigoriresistens TaxID=2683708 RepID=A0A942UWM6_9FIRM|nr:class I SAM-dependent methyltransferase [Anaeromonas frigoriresistens]MBS4539953.1 class I SAM-dependent methyltransferase [Anaeromonas frigoriresistens]
MSKRLLTKATDLAKHVIDIKLQKGMTAVDATIGNGNDTLELAKRVGSNGKVYGFDIQKVAIDSSKELLEKNNLLDRVELICDSHERISEYINDKIDLAIFNLGYLPSGDHSIITKPNTTLKGIESVLYSLKENGILIVVVYYGHSGGKEEKIAVEKYLNKLDQRKFTVMKMDFINQINNPPFIFCIEKI